MKEIRLTSTKKTKFSEFNLEELRGWIIDRMYQIEVKIDFIILDYYKPEKRSEFLKIILNSSIISIGGKIKILNNIEDFDKKIISKIQKIAPIRNAFAHLPVTEQINISIDEDAEGNLISSKIDEIIAEMEVMTSSGQLRRKKTSELRDEFIKLNKEIREYLINYS